MPRSLARGNYTAQQVDDALRANVATYKCRFDLLNRNLDLVSDVVLDVTDATVDWDGDRQLPRSLTMTMRPNTRLYASPFQYLVRPVFSIKMPAVDGGYADFPMGTYVWTVPKRTIEDRAVLTDPTVERWSVTLADQTHILDLGGPHTQGFRISSGSSLPEAILRIIAAATGKGLSNEGRWWKQESKASWQTLSWALRTGYKKDWVKRSGAQKKLRELIEDETTSWLGILTFLHSELGWQPPGYDLDADQYAISPVTDYANVQASAVIGYRVGRDSGLLRPGIQSDPDLTEIANFATVSSSTASGSQMVATADLNTLIPGHPLSQAVLGFYIDVASTSSTAVDYLTLLGKAKALLYEHVRGVEKVSFDTLANPAHDAWEVVSLQVPGDAEYATPQLFAESHWSLDLFTGEMGHAGRRLFIAAQ